MQLTGTQLPLKNPPRGGEEKEPTSPFLSTAWDSTAEQG